MQPQTLDEWLAWQQGLHVKNISLGLERVKEVYQRLSPKRIAQKVITVAGTNGKGSTVAYYETWLKNQGYRVASYTSPHLWRYNERVKLNLQPVTDSQLCIAFEKVERARKKTELTYFEFGTLAAFIIISDFKADFAILEIGLGGRLDAVNIIDPDLSHITTIGLDHQEWLGSTREAIGYEKAGILRSQGLAICNDPQPPQSVLAELQRLQCRFMSLGHDYHFDWMNQVQIHWQGRTRDLNIDLPLLGKHQAQNISGVLAGLELMGCFEGKTAESINQGFADATCPGRLQSIPSALKATLLLDVGHNPDAAISLADYLNQQSGQGRVFVLLGMLEDKNTVEFVEILNDVVDEWWLLSLNMPRGLSASALAQRLEGVVRKPLQFDSIEKSMAHAMSSLDNQDILLVTGSFMTVEAALKSTFVNLK
ncbi:MAG: folylpolyglutamate synthase/dihydrofolate synthase family protein [Gammaproteobacteria bacterium]|nr:folylpolyglutamate synthase/dihydrofolate synthase family protein [Gammaproteobacteria bacterium]